MPGGAGQLRLTGGMTAGRDGKRKPGSNPFVRRYRMRCPNAAANAAARRRVTGAAAVLPRSGSEASQYAPASASVTGVIPGARSRA